MTRTQRDGLLLILISAAGYSFFAIFTKFIYDNSSFNPLDVVVWRFVLAVPITWLGMGWIRRGELSVKTTYMPRGRLLGMGFLFGLVATIAFFGLERVPASLYTVLIYTYPVLVAVGAVLFGETLSERSWLALGLTLVGVVLTVPNLFQGFSGVDPIGVLLVLANAATYALYILLSNRTVKGVTDLSMASAWSISGSLIFSLIVIILRALRGDSTSIPPNISVWAGFLGLVIISTVIPIFTFYAGMYRVGAPRAAIISMLEPVLTLLWAVVIRHENLQWIQLFGASFILVSVLLLQRIREKPVTEPIPSAAGRGSL
ncbi:MAG: EamA family transporter [Anaerolineaceae bacterium]|nr:EamA family transporter [Anaerolineaceae bacterium]